MDQEGLAESMNPGDVLEGRGCLLHQGRLVAPVDYHLTIPRETHFVINPTGSFSLDYDQHLGGFILLSLNEADNISLADYTLELADKSKKTIRVERRYKKIRFNGQLRISFWVKVI